MPSDQPGGRVENGGRRHGCIERDRHQTHCKAFRLRLGCVYLLIWQRSLAGFVAVRLTLILAVWSGNPQMVRQPFRRFNLTAAQDVSRQGDQIAALVVRCKIRPRAGIAVNRERPRLVVTAKRVQGLIFTALILAARQSEKGRHAVKISQGGRCYFADKVIRHFQPHCAKASPP